MIIGEKFRNFLGTRYEIIAIHENKVDCVILDGLYKGGVSELTKEEIERYLK